MNGAFRDASEDGLVVSAQFNAEPVRAMRVMESEKEVGDVRQSENVMPDTITMINLVWTA